MIELKNIFVFCAFVFVFGIISGWIFFPFFEGYMEEIIDAAFGDILTKGGANLTLMIFTRNVQASGIMLALGPTVILCLAILWFNGFFVSLVLIHSIKNGLDPSIVILGLVPHGIFEIPALFLSAALGLNIVTRTIYAKNARFLEFKRAIVYAIKWHVLLVIPALVIAAIVEVNVSAYLIS